MKRSYEGVPYSQLTAAMKADLDADVRAVLDEDVDLVGASLQPVAVDDPELDTGDWASLVAKGPPR